MIGQRMLEKNMQIINEAREMQINAKRRMLSHVPSRRDEIGGINAQEVITCDKGSIKSQGLNKSFNLRSTNHECFNSK